jgi:hypothetical protein
MLSVTGGITGGTTSGATYFGIEVGSSDPPGSGSAEATVAAGHGTIGTRTTRAAASTRNLCAFIEVDMPLPDCRHRA